MNIQFLVMLIYINMPKEDLNMFICCNNGLIKAMNVQPNFMWCIFFYSLRGGGRWGLI